MSPQTEVYEVSGSVLSRNATSADLQVSRAYANVLSRNVTSADLHVSRAYANVLTRPKYAPDHQGGWGLILPGW